MKKIILAILVIGLILYGGVRWDIYRWHTFQEETGSDISYIKWKWVIEKSDSK